MSNTDKAKHPRVYRDHRQETLIIITVIIVILGYVFFFTSGYLFKDTSVATPLDSPITFSEDTRSVTLLEADYSPSQETMEIKIQLTNKTFDGIDDYYFEADVLRGNKNTLKVKQVVHTEILTVIQISGVKPRYRELTLYLAPKLKNVAQKNLYALVVNNKNCKSTSHIEAKTLTEYLVDRLKLTISRLTKEFDANTAKIKANTTLIQKMSSKNTELEKSKMYLTLDEIELVSDQIANNKAQIKTLQNDNAALEATNKDLTQQIEDATFRIKKMKEGN